MKQYHRRLVNKYYKNWKLDYQHLTTKQLVNKQRTILKHAKIMHRSNLYLQKVNKGILILETKVSKEAKKLIPTKNYFYNLETQIKYTQNDTIRNLNKLNKQIKKPLNLQYRTLKLVANKENINILEMIEQKKIKRGYLLPHEKLYQEVSDSEEWKKMWYAKDPIKFAHFAPNFQEESLMINLLDKV